MNDSIDQEAESGFNKPAWRAWKLSSTSSMMINLYDQNAGKEPVLLGIAWNPQTPRHILSLLAEDTIPGVKRAAGYRLSL